MAPKGTGPKKGPRAARTESNLGGGRNATGASRLVGFVERLERLAAEIDELKDDVKEVKAEAKAEGFDIKTIAALLKLRKLTDDERREREALLDLYKAAIGMLDGTPLGEAARRRFDDGKGKDGGDGAGAGAGEEEDSSAGTQGAEAFGFEELEAARERGGADALAGVRVLQNPFVAGDPRRAKWDEGWCREKGSDGMDLPAAWRRRAPDGDKDAGGGDGKGAGA
jgi:uncharacterized protein (UPF0335 family)